MRGQTQIRHLYKQNITQHTWADYEPPLFLSLCWDNCANTLRAARDLSGFGAIIYSFAHFWLTLSNPPGPSGPGCDSARPVSSSCLLSLGRPASTGWKLEVERQSRLGWDAIQVQSQRNGVSMSGWAMNCEAVAPPPRDTSLLTAAIWGLISILFTSNPDIKWQSFLSLSFPLYHPLPGM